jgi:hypothetical protein
VFELIVHPHSVVIVSAMRLASLMRVDTTDITYTVAMPIMWSALEPCIGITLACVPLLRPLFGGRYTPTGTARFGASSKSFKNTKSIHTLSKSGSRRFEKFHDDYSITQLGSVADLRPEPLQYNANVKTKDGRQIESTRDHDDNVELCSITVKKGWRVESGSGEEG